jgi:hypothetical protein
MYKYYQIYKRKKDIQCEILRDLKAAAKMSEGNDRTNEINQPGKNKELWAFHISISPNDDDDTGCRISLEYIRFFISLRRETVHLLSLDRSLE